MARQVSRMYLRQQSMVGADAGKLSAQGMPVRPRFVLLFTLLLFMFFVFQGLSPAWAVDRCYSIASGDILIEPDGSGIKVTVDAAVQNPAIQAGDRIIIEGSTAANTVTVSGNVKPEIILMNVNIDVSGAYDTCAFKITGGAAVDLTLSGDNILKSGTGNAGLEVSTGNTLTVRGTDADTLTAAGGGSHYGGAGIGGSYNSSGSYDSYAGNITVTGGTVNANGARFAAGIGGGYGGSGGTITISGGTVNANGGNYGAGIGNGPLGSGGAVTISGGAVNANGGISAAGIGGGIFANGGAITITGGAVTANGAGGAGIGGGNGGSGGAITISGGTVSANGAKGGADIGPGNGGDSNGTITITGGSVRPMTGINAVRKQPRSGSGGSDVFLNTLTVGNPSVPPDTLITACSVDGASGYGIKDVYTDTDGKVYFWLPKEMDGRVEVTAEGNRYGETFTRSGDNTVAILPLISNPNPNPGPNPSPTGVPVTGVTLVSSDLTLEIGQKGQLRATVSPDDATNKNLIWNSRDPKIASVDKNGVVLGVSPGTTVITVETKDGGFKAGCTVTVTKTGEIIVIDLSDLNLKDNTLHLILGQPADMTIAANTAGASFTATGLPPGLMLSAGGRLTGAPEALGVWPVTVTAALSDGTAGTAGFIISVRETEDSGGGSGSCATGVFGWFAVIAFAVTRPNGKRGKNTA